MRIVPAVIAVCCLLIVGLKDQDPPGKQVAMYADLFLKQLDDDQKSVAVMDYDSEKRVDWHFIPKDERKGLRIGEMSTHAARRGASHAAFGAERSRIRESQPDHAPRRRAS